MIIEMKPLPSHTGSIRRRWFIRNASAANLLENFIISAVASVLVIRLFLELTGFPQLGGGGLHIAHMLWGGLGMLIAIIIMLAFADYTAKAWATVIGGIGFGAFIDELGKFITSDNNYFYQPAVAAIYVVFVVLFLAVRRLNRPGALSPEESLANAAEIVREGMLAGGLEESDRKTAGELLDRSDPAEPLAQALRGVLEKTASLPDRRPAFITRVRHTLARFYRELALNRWFEWLVVGIFAATAVADLGWIAFNLDWSWITAAGVISGGLALWALLYHFRAAPLWQRATRWALVVAVTTILVWTVIINLQESPGSFADWVEFITATTTGIFILTGVTTIHRSKLKAYQWFRRALLISILVTQVFTFYEYQFVALGALAVNLLLFVALRYMISQEEAKAEPR